MKRVVNIAKNFKQAEEWDIEQQINMTIQERMAIARELRVRVYGKNIVSLRQWKK